MNNFTENCNTGCPIKNREFSDEFDIVFVFDLAL